MTDSQDIPVGLCQCGCGEKTSIAKQNAPKYGQVRGEPVRYIKGHGRRRPLSSRLWEKVAKSGQDDCWVWTGYLDRAGYGRIRTAAGMSPAHRVAYEASIGPIPEGLQIDHLCRNPRCVNPAHLEPVTNRENQIRGIGFAAVNAAKTHCIRGHPFDEENTYTQSNGRRSCRACAKERRQKGAA